MATETISKATVADAFRAIGELVDQFDIPTAPVGEIHLVAWLSRGQAARIVAAMTDVTAEPYNSDTTSYLIHRGRLVGIPIEIMESRDD